jgi:hypothetical protein
MRCRCRALSTRSVIAAGVAGCRSDANLVNALCGSGGADPPLTCEINAGRPAANPVVGSVELEPVDAEPAVVSPFTA